MRRLDETAPGPLANATTAAVVFAVIVGMTTVARGAEDPAESSDARNALLAADLRRAVDAQDFNDVLDKAPPRSAEAKRLAGHHRTYEPTAAEMLREAAEPTATESQPIHQTPNVDVTVIELNDDGSPREAADVLLSPQYPQGIIVPLDRNLSTDKVRWRFWDDAEWDNNGGRGTTDVVPGHEKAPLDFMSPYPASVLKLMVGFGVLRLVDAGKISLDDEYAYVPVGTPRPACGGAVTKPIKQFFDEMITVSKNESTCALIKLLHDHQAMDSLNQEFVDLGLEMLRLVGTDPNTGGRWGGSNMNALDTAKLLLLINGGAGTLWRAPDGTPVTKSVLSDSSRSFFLTMLGEQGLNQVLSTTNWCGRAYPAPGIPQLTPERWINPTDGTMTIDGRVYGQDVRPCQATAEVTYAHKTGFVDTSGNDAGIVKSLPGKDQRNYIVVIQSNLGDRYIDVNRPADPPGIYPVVYTEKYGKLGLAIDTFVTRHFAVR